MRIVITGLPRLVLETVESHLCTRGHQVLVFTDLMATSLPVVRPNLAHLVVVTGPDVRQEHLARIKLWQSYEPSVRVVTFREDGGRRYHPGLRVTGVLTTDTSWAGLERVLLGQEQVCVPQQRHGSGWSPDQELSSREREIVQLLVRGFSSAQMSLDLGLSVGTIHSHVQGAMRKLGARDRVEAVHRYLNARSPMDLGTS